VHNNDSEDIRIVGVQGKCDRVIKKRHIEQLGDEFPARLLVMQVEHKEGIWNRLNMGKIEKAWEGAESEWKLIVVG
jgi:hypothetical protein